MQSRREYRRKKLKELIDDMNKLDMKVQRLEISLEDNTFPHKSDEIKAEIETLNQQIAEKKELAATLMAFREQNKNMNGKTHHSQTNE